MGSKSKRRNHQPPPQSRVIPAGQVPLIDPNRQHQEAQQQQAVIGSKIENLTAQLFVENVYIDTIKPEDEYREYVSAMVRRSIDAALIFAKELWNVEAKRMPSPAEAESLTNARQATPPQPIIEE
jgi:hypothetical protein